MNHTYINKLIIIVFLFISSNFLYSQDCMEIGNSSTYASNQGCSGTTLRACPDGMVVVGYKGRTGAHFDNYQIGCRALEVDGSLKASEVSLEEEVTDARTVVKEGQEIEVKITGIDRKKRAINLSIKAKESDDEQTTAKDYAPETSENSKLGDILKEELKK